MRPLFGRGDRRFGRGHLELHHVGDVQPGDAGEFGVLDAHGRIDVAGVGAPGARRAGLPPLAASRANCRAASQFSGPCPDSARERSPNIGSPAKGCVDGFMPSFGSSSSATGRCYGRSDCLGLAAVVSRWSGSAESRLVAGASPLAWALTCCHGSRATCPCRGVGRGEPARRAGGQAARRDRSGGRTARSRRADRRRPSRRDRRRR